MKLRTLAYAELIGLLCIGVIGCEQKRSSILKTNFCQGSSYQGWNADNFLVDVNYYPSIDSIKESGNLDLARFLLLASTTLDKNVKSEKVNLIVVSRDKILIHNATWPYKNVLNMLKERCLRPANVWEFLSFISKYPNQNFYPVVALGSIGQDNMGYPVAPSLTLFGSQREINFDRIENGWHDYDCFLAVRE